MKCLSVLQPWSWAILHGGKTVENRTWNTSHRGPLLIHTGKGRRWFVGPGLNAAEEVFEDNRVRFPDVDTLPFGAVVGVADLVEVVNGRGFRWGRYGWREPGCFWWMLESATAFPEPITLSGRTQLYDVPITYVLEQLRRVGWVDEGSGQVRRPASILAKAAG
jgi:hypothetical protein